MKRIGKCGEDGPTIRLRCNLALLSAAPPRFHVDDVSDRPQPIGPSCQVRPYEPLKLKAPSPQSSIVSFRFTRYWISSPCTVWSPRRCAFSLLIGASLGENGTESDVDYQPSNVERNATQRPVIASACSTENYFARGPQVNSTGGLL
jgi:hypothetical protein